MPIVEFEISRGLRQGDPLSPFLFILAMEGLHAIIEKAKSVNLFTGVEVRTTRLRISHLLYADDVIFMGEWSFQNAVNLIGLLRCFYVISGLKINVSRSNIYGIGVEEVACRGMAAVLGCGMATIPFKYLAVLVGCDKSKIGNWKDVVEKFKVKLSNWRAGILSVGGRLTLIKSVLSNLPIYYMSIYKMPIAVEKTLEAMRNKFFIGGDMEERKMTWVAWKKCLASKEFGGLSIGSIFALNRALLFKWVWRFRNNCTDLWANVISSIYGVDGGIGRERRGFIGSPWSAVLNSVSQLRDRDVDMFGECVRTVGDGSCTAFWHDVWLGDRSLKVRYNRLFVLDLDKECRVADRVSRRDWDSCLRGVATIHRIGG